MSRQSAFESFLYVFRIDARPPASQAAISKLESELSLVLPEELRECYLQCDGGETKHDCSSIEILSVETAARYHRASGLGNNIWGYFPIIENNDSNPICVCCKPPLRGCVVLVLHDDQPRLMFRTLDAFFRAAADAVRKSTEFFDTYNLPSEFDGPERTAEDRRIAGQLISLATDDSELEDEDRTDALRFACDLLADDDIDELRTMMEAENEYVREHVLNRLKRAESTAAKELLSQFRHQFEEFLDYCVATLKAANIPASKERNSIRIDPWPIWLNMEMFYSQRNRPDFDEHLMERANTFIEQRSG